MIAELLGVGQVLGDGQIERLFWARPVAPTVMMKGSLAGDAFIGLKSEPSQ